MLPAAACASRLSTAPCTASPDRSACSTHAAKIHRATAACSPSRPPPQTRQIARRPACLACCPASSVCCKRMKRSSCCSASAMRWSVACCASTRLQERSASCACRAIRNVPAVVQTRSSAATRTSNRSAQRTDRSLLRMLALGKRQREQLLLSRFLDVFRLPVRVRFAVDALARRILAQLGAALGGSFAIPVGEAIAAESGQDHQVDVLHVVALDVEVLQQAAERRGL